MAVPTIDGIDWDNFRYHPVYGAQHHRGIFEWGFLYKESVVPDRELKRRKHTVNLTSKKIVITANKI